MQTLQQEIDPSGQNLTTQDHPVLRGLMADQAVAYAEEVRALRQRVAVLEADLAAAKASQAIDTTKSREAPRPSIVGTPPCHTNALATSEFTEHRTPAVAPAHVAPTTRTPARASVVVAPAKATAPVSDPGFAQAWSNEDDEASFEERLAEKAFFQAATVDEQSRSWLLDS